jgi:hypothetical protein
MDLLNTDPREVARRLAESVGLTLRDLEEETQ